MNFSNKFCFILMFSVYALFSSAEEKNSIGNIDPNMQVDKSRETGLVWYSPKEKPFKIAGFAWFEKDKLYRRLPLNAPFSVPKAVNTLAEHTSCGQVKFRTNSKRLAINVKLNKSIGSMYHMPATGQCGFDLYAGGPGNQKHYSTASLNANDTEYQARLFNKKDGLMREFTLNFPLYCGVKELSIGLEPGAEIEAPSPYASEKSIVIYGGSTIQGACASRPGSCHMNIISRLMNMQVINLGFSGSGKLEPELAQIMCEIPGPAVYIIECERNSKYKLLSERQENFIKILRQKHPSVPIIILTANPRAPEALGIDTVGRMKNWHFMHDLVDKLQKEGDRNIYFIDSSKMVGEDFYECVVDGSHPNDLGFYRMAQGLFPVLKEILKIN